MGLYCVHVLELCNETISFFPQIKMVQLKANKKAQNSVLSNSSTSFTTVRIRDFHEHQVWSQLELSDITILRNRSFVICLRSSATFTDIIPPSNNPCCFSLYSLPL